MKKCDGGGCENIAKWHTHFLGTCFLDLCEECEEKLFPAGVFGTKMEAQCTNEVVGL